MRFMKKICFGSLFFKKPLYVRLNVTPVYSIKYSGILSDPNSTKKPRGVLGNFVITRKSYVFEKCFARLHKPLKVSKQLREDILPNSSKKTICIIVYSNLQPSMFHVKDV